ncbi:MAG: AAA family ATPase [Gammaproteobacteria bacterium]|nr:AAA family ATPase [Gammaproteobacteria bacterium]MBU1505809.1 AAA family ATPase [Gammaproteobacteria bacterium]MBU2119497.1 AAA family ATPase [Gammaproteobacteria bacterium]MBU2172597.1 AAA family ATPase [Gammaproteobacteria bacterium]MBU2202055.1 AAA family ATPase [Gammaproteobacteria bacterium]
MMNLPQDLAYVDSNQSQLARHVGISRAAVTQIVKYRIWPATRGLSEKLLKERITAFLTAKGLPAERLARTFDEAPAAPRANAELQAMAKANNSGPQPGDNQGEDPFMLLRHHSLSSAARQHFKILRDPFVNELNEDADVFITDDIRYVRAAMRHTARHGGMLAVVAESGGGKSTLRQDMIDWINTTGERVTVIEPYVIGMEDSHRKGKALMAADITGAVIRTVSPGTSLRQVLQDRAAQMHNILKASAQVGQRHVLIIEEAHALAIPTLKHLKRFYELQDGFKKLLSIILVGQTELEKKLSEHNPEVREVVQRCELVKLPPLDNHVEGYLRHKVERAGLQFEAIFASDAMDAIRSTLRQAVSETVRGQRQAREQSLCYPLAINNLVTRAMNEAVKIGAPKVTAALIAAAVRGS